MNTAGGVGGWTHYFTASSALSMVALQMARLFGAPRRTAVVVGVFGAVLPMVFGMAYLLLPSYAGRTLSTPRLPGVHFVVAYAGAGILAADTFVEVGPQLLALGGLLWSFGVAIFVGTLLWTILPAVVHDPEIVLRSPDRPQRSTRLATATIPVGVGYLVVGTVALLSTVTSLPDFVGASLPSVIHYYAAGFAGLLVFALGIRLLTGFFHEVPPATLAWVVLLSGAVGPGLLAANFWQPPWFHVGAVLELVAAVGYAGLVGVVASRTDRRRVGLSGIVLGALGGAVAVVSVVLVAFGVGTAGLVNVHIDAVLSGFFLLTIIGYVYQFFPVTNGRFPGATERTALATILLLAAGVSLQALGAVVARSWVRTAGSGLAVLGTAGYSYLTLRRLAG